MKITTNKEAREQGLKTFFSGVPCRHGHVAPRRRDSQSSRCMECLRLDALKGALREKKNRVIKQQKNEVAALMRGYGEAEYGHLDNTPISDILYIERGIHRIFHEGAE